jgi:hypothetical protein
LILNGMSCNYGYLHRFSSMGIDTSFNVVRSSRLENSQAPKCAP